MRSPKAAKNEKTLEAVPKIVIQESERISTMVSKPPVPEGIVGNLIRVFILMILLTALVYILTRVAM